MATPKFEDTEPLAYEDTLPVEGEKETSALTKVAQAITTPVRGFRGMGVAAQRALGESGMADVASIPFNPTATSRISQSIFKNAGKALERGAEAVKPGFVPEKGERLGAALGETAAVVGLTAGLPMGGTLLRQMLMGGSVAGGQNALMQQAETGKIRKDYVAYNALFGGALPVVPRIFSSIASSAEDAVPEMVLKATGHTKRFLGTRGKVDRAFQDARVLAKEPGFITPTTTPEQLAEKIAQIKVREGQIIANGLREASDNGGNVIDLEQFVYKLEAMEKFSEATGKKLKGGYHKEINDTLKKAKETVMARFLKDKDGKTIFVPVSPQEANELKTVLQNVAYNEEKDNILARTISGEYRTYIDQELGNAIDKIGNPALKSTLRNSKRLYGAAANMEDPVYNRISSELGNKKIGITDWILAAPQIALGSPQFAMTIVAKKALEKYGPTTAVPALRNVQAGARAAQRAFRNPTTQSIIRSSALGLREN